MIDWVIIAKVGWPIVAAAAAWGGAKQALNGTRDRVVKLENWTEKHNHTHVDLIDRAARMETKLDILIKQERK